MMKPPKRAPGEPSWFWRRTVLFVVCGWCMVMLWRLVGTEDTEVHEAIVSGLVMLLGALVLGYQGFATAQDIAAILSTRSGTPYRDSLPAEPYGGHGFDITDDQRAPGAGLR
jgi:hypothetical protein